MIVQQVSAGRLSIDTGSGDVTVQDGVAGKVIADTGSGSVGYADAVLRKSGKKVVGAKRGDGRTRIRVETGSGDCTIRPKG